MRTLRIFWAYLVRDALMSSSYRLAFAMQIASLGLGVVSLYFFSKLIGQNATIDTYGGYLPFSVIGMAVTSYFTTGFSSFSGSLRNEQMMGTLEAMLMTPARISSIVMATSVWQFIWTTVSAVITVVAASVFLDVHIAGSFATALLLLVLTTITFSCLGILSASFIMVFKRGDPFGFFAGTVSFLLGGVVYPTQILPHWLQAVSKWLPITHGLQGIRDVLLAGRGFQEVLPQIFILLAFIAAGLPTSLWVFRKSVNFARREGSLVHY